MCGGDGGAGAARAAAAEQAREYEKALATQEKANAATIEAMKVNYTPPPVPTMATIDSAYQGVQPKKTRKSSIIDANKGISGSLKIPMNTGGSSSGGTTNLG